MSILDLYQSSEHRNNLAHFAAIVNLALVDGEINPEEKSKVERFARKLDISEEEYQEIIESPKKYPLRTIVSSEERMQRMFDFFKVIFADHIIDEAELGMVNRYAIGLGYSSEKAEELIKKSIKIFSGDIDFEDFEYLIKK
ncbi:MAG: TerB family tellurite resistance protein [Flavobacteriales bacterium]